MQLYVSAAHLLTLVIQVILATMVVLRAGNRRTARYFVLMSVGQGLVSAGEALRAIERVSNETQGNVLIITGLGILPASFILLLGSMFAPSWWQGRRPIRWIIAPYLLLLVVFTLDRLVGPHWFVAADGSGAPPTGPTAFLLLILGFLVSLVLLVVTIIRRPVFRRSSAILLATIGIGVVTGSLSGFVPSLQELFRLLPNLLTPLGLGYVVLRTRLFEPRRAGLDLALRSLSDAVVVLDQQQRLVFANPAAAQLGFSTAAATASILPISDDAHQQVNALIAQHQTTVATGRVQVGRRQISVLVSPITDDDDLPQGILVLGRDITDTEMRTTQLESERTRLAHTVLALEAAQRDQARLAQTVISLTIPIIPVLEGVLVSPLVGSFDAARAAQFTDVLLGTVERERAHLVLLDMTSLIEVDDAGADGLLQSVRALRLLGTRGVLVGVRP